MPDVARGDCVGILYRTVTGRTRVMNGSVNRVTATIIQVKHLNIFGTIVYTNIVRSAIRRIVLLSV